MKAGKPALPSGRCGWKYCSLSRKKHDYAKCNRAFSYRTRQRPERRRAPRAHRLGQSALAQGIPGRAHQGCSPYRDDPRRSHLRYPRLPPGRREVREGRRDGQPRQGDERPSGQGGARARSEVSGRDPRCAPRQGCLRLHGRSAPRQPRERLLRLLARRVLGQELALARRRLERLLSGSPSQVVLGSLVPRNFPRLLGPFGSLHASFALTVKSGCPDEVFFI